jgi:hypothetical protein
MEHYGFGEEILMVNSAVVIPLLILNLAQCNLYQEAQIGNKSQWETVQELQLKLTDHCGFGEIINLEQPELRVSPQIYQARYRL